MKDFEIRCDTSRLEISNNNNSHILYGKFTLGPFLPGQGTTFGNALRRSLLSELSGLAITAFEILGIMQEFSTLPGLRESILDLSLNLKQVVLTGVLPHSIPPIGFLKRKGPAIIKAMDLKLPAGVYCTSPDQYIATLSSNGDLNLKFLVSVGKGYSVQPYSLYRSLSKIKLHSTCEVLPSSFTEGKTAYPSSNPLPPASSVGKAEQAGTRGVIASISKVGSEAQLPTDTCACLPEEYTQHSKQKQVLPHTKINQKDILSGSRSASQKLQTDSFYFLEEQNKEGIAYSEKLSTKSSSSLPSDSVGRREALFNNTKNKESKNISNSEYISSAPKHIRSNSTNFSDAHSASYLRAAFTSDYIPKVISSTDAENKSQQSTEKQNNTPFRSSVGNKAKTDPLLLLSTETKQEVKSKKSMQQKDTKGSIRALTDPKSMQLYPKKGLGVREVNAYPKGLHKGTSNTGHPTVSYRAKLRYGRSSGMEAVLRTQRKSISNKESNNKSINQLEEDLSPTSFKTVTNTTFSYQTYIHSNEGYYPNLSTENKRCFDIQTQIFQRVNPHQVLPIDAVFTPVSRVNFLTQVNDRFETARENIVLEIWTNGSIHPKKALEEATLLLVQNFDTLLKNIQKASSISKGVHYVNYLHTSASIPKVGSEAQLPMDARAVCTGLRTYSTHRGTQSTGTSVGDYTFPTVSVGNGASEGSKAELPNKSSLNLQSKNTEESANNKRNAFHIEDLRSKEAVSIPKVTMQRDSSGTKRVEKEGVTYIEQLSNIPSSPEFLPTEMGLRSRGMQELSKKHLHQAVFNLDIGNFNFSLQTFIALKEAKIHTLSQLLTLFSLEDKKFDINLKSLPERYALPPSKVEESVPERSLLFKEKIVDELKNVIRHFIALTS